MTCYPRGQRVALDHTDDPHTRLRPGDTGTVRRWHPDTRTVDIDWDNGSTLAMCLDAGDRIRPLDPPTDTRPPAGTRRRPGRGSGGPDWEQILDGLRAAGTRAGRTAADWWAQDTVGGRAGGDTTATAGRVLAGIDDGDPAVLDALPAPPAADDDTCWYTDIVDAPSWPQLIGRQRDQVWQAWCDGFTDGAVAAVYDRCRAAAEPVDHGTDRSGPHPDRLRVGGVGVFAGDWTWTPHPDGSMRIPVGFVGTLVDTWNGWAVFTCTRQVAEAIVADQARQRRRYRQRLRARGVPDHDLDHRVDLALARMSFDGDTVVVDERATTGDPEAVERISPDADGRYDVMGRAWCWQPVDPADCDHIVGQLPDRPEDTNP